MSKLTRRERSAINKAKFRAERGGSSSSGYRSRASEIPSTPVPKGWVTVNRGEEPYQFKVFKGKVWAFPYDPDGSERGPYNSYDEALHYMVTVGDEPRFLGG